MKRRSSTKRPFSQLSQVTLWMVAAALLGIYVWLTSHPDPERRPPPPPLPEVLWVDAGEPVAPTGEGDIAEEAPSEPPPREPVELPEPTPARTAAKTAAPAPRIKRRGTSTPTIDGSAGGKARTAGTTTDIDRVQRKPTPRPEPRTDIAGGALEME